MRTRSRISLIDSQTGEIARLQSHKVTMEANIGVCIVCVKDSYSTCKRRDFCTAGTNLSVYDCGDRTCLGHEYRAI